MKTPLEKCANCGDAFKMTINAVGERAKRRWCAGCWAQYSRMAKINADGNREIDKDGNQVFRNTTGHGAPRGHASRPDWNRP